MMTKSEAMAVNVLLRACGIRTDQTVGVSDDAVVLAIHLLTKSAHKAIGAGVRTSDVERWRADEGIVPSSDLFGTLEELKSLDAQVWLDQATELTCNEVDVFHELLGAVGSTEIAAQFMAAHTDDGDECDRHVEEVEATACD